MRPGHCSEAGAPGGCSDCQGTWGLQRGGRLGRDCSSASVVCRLPTRALLNSAARLHQRSSTFPLEARIGLALALLGGRRSSCRHRPESVRYCGVLKLCRFLVGRSCSPQYQR